jgi:CxxC motif-containing protein (DUF1111 family)
VATSSLAVAAIGGCTSAAAGTGGIDESTTSETAQRVTAIGGALPGTDPVRFQDALDNFAQEEDINDGLGPTFNERACGNCHTTPVVGGSGIQVERRFGRVTNGVFFGFDRAPDNEGGTLRQLSSNDPYVNGTTTCTVPLDKEAPTANIHNVGRRTLPLFGLGLVDAMPDSWFDALAANEPAGTRGVVLRAIPQFPDSRDPNQSLTRQRVARFGIKDQQTNLVSFSGDAYVNEMGITTQSCFKGTSILAFASENYPNNVSPPAGCNGGDLAKPQTTPGVPVETDDAVGDCTNLDETQDDLDNFRFFMEHLAPPPQAALDPLTALVGTFLFSAVGCADCHSSQAFVTPRAPFNGVPGNFTFFPFSDFLVHDMGSLGDGIGNTGDSVAITRRMRTAPLWGVRFNTQLLHDGRAATVRDAIVAHDGQGLVAKLVFSLLLSPGEQDILVRYVNAL